MQTLSHLTSMLLMIDLQVKLMPAMLGGASTVENARRLLSAAEMMDVSVLVTEQNPGKLGSTVLALSSDWPVLSKMTFDAGRAEGFTPLLPERQDVVVAGWEAHVCVLQTVLGLLDRKRRVFIVRDAIGARSAENKDAAIRRMERHGAEIVTTEMVMFEWLGTADHPRFREVVSLVK